MIKEGLTNDVFLLMTMTMLLKLVNASLVYILLLFCPLYRIILQAKSLYGYHSDRNLGAVDIKYRSNECWINTVA